jgi:hypothetical protein
MAVFQRTSALFSLSCTFADILLLKQELRNFRERAENKPKEDFYVLKRIVK